MRLFFIWIIVSMIAMTTVFAYPVCDGLNESNYWTDSHFHSVDDIGYNITMRCHDDVAGYMYATGIDCTFWNSIMGNPTYDVWPITLAYDPAPVEYNYTTNMSIQNASQYCMVVATSDVQAFYPVNFFFEQTYDPTLGCTIFPLYVSPNPTLNFSYDWMFSCSGQNITAVNVTCSNNESFSFNTTGVTTFDFNQNILISNDTVYCLVSADSNFSQENYTTRIEWDRIPVNLFSAGTCPVTTIPETLIFLGLLALFMTTIIIAFKYTIPLVGFVASLVLMISSWFITACQTFFGSAIFFIGLAFLLLFAFGGVKKRR